MRVKYSIGKLQKIAKERGGECLSTEYTGILSMYRWRCSDGHEWSARASSIIHQNSWCKSCSLKNAWLQRKHTIDDVNLYANKNGGKCISEKYENTKAKLLFECRNGHRWRTTFEKIKMGRWCPTCYSESRKGNFQYNLEDIKEAAKKLGGECLSTEYLGINEPLDFRCGNGHRFSRIPALITKTNPLNRVWCPYCNNINHSENLCRAVIEVAYKRDFPNMYPGEWLKNNRGRKMQLDGFNQELLIAFEYNGQQHYEPLAKFKDTESKFNRRVEDDILKAELCRQNSVNLICIPAFETIHLSLKEIIQHVSKAFQAQGTNLPIVTLREVKKRLEYYGGAQIKKLQTIAKENNGELLSRIYMGMGVRHKWKCSQGHEWESVPASVQNGTWCPECAGNTVNSLDKMQQLAKKRGGKCLSRTYVNGKSHLRWECDRCSHQWLAMPSNIQKGHWCPECARKKSLKKGLSSLYSYLIKYDGQLISDYKGTKSQVSIKCKNGHVFKCIPENLIKTQSWCPICREEEKIFNQLKKLRMVVENKGGKILGEYKGLKEKIDFECKNGHRFRMKPAAVIHGKQSWCKACHFEDIRVRMENWLHGVVKKKNGAVKGKYINSKTKLTFVCEFGHQWSTVPDLVLRGSWCPICK